MGNVKIKEVEGGGGIVIMTGFDSIRCAKKNKDMKKTLRPRRSVDGSRAIAFEKSPEQSATGAVYLYNIYIYI